MLLRRCLRHPVRVILLRRRQRRLVARVRPFRHPVLVLRRRRHRRREQVAGVAGAPSLRVSSAGACHGAEARVEGDAAVPGLRQRVRHVALGLRVHLGEVGGPVERRDRGRRSRGARQVLGQPQHLQACTATRVKGVEYSADIVVAVVHAHRTYGILKGSHGHLRRATVLEATAEGVGETHHGKLVLHVIQDVRHLGEAPVVAHQVLEVPVALDGAAEGLIVPREGREGDLAIPIDTRTSAGRRHCASDPILLAVAEVAEALQPHG
mmetsp:Transcript_15461/g.46407  ORF Transcript_15461/g.46407 Transcript_15461/m.46407 type:complete len:266 (+) Transcript_15461:2648-3445(+)